MSLRVRLLLAFAYVLIVVLVMLEIPLGLNVAGRVDAEVEAQAASEAHLIAATASGRLEVPEVLDRVVSRAGGDVNGRVIIADAWGNLLADSAGPGLLGTSYASRPEIEQVLADGSVAQGNRTSETLDEELLYTAVPIVEDGVRVGVVRVTQSVDAVRGEVRRDLFALAGIGVLALVLGLGLAWILAGSLARPLRALARTADRVAGGDLAARAVEEGSAEQREVARAFNDMTGRLARSLETQREFVANASHQLRTPLTGLRLRLESAALHADHPDLAEDIAAAERETDRLAQLVEDLLTLADTDAQRPEPEPVALDNEAHHARDRWLHRATEADQELVLIGEGPVCAMASREDIGAILDNLIENALVYSPPGSKVSVVWGRREETAYAAVLDEGPGLSADELEIVFDRFARGTAGKRRPGSGLGLAIVRALAERWGGSAQITNRDAGGASAEVTLPAGPSPTIESTRASSAAPRERVGAP
ncbi:MAG: HAMP domain-containing sensor histidine kinase [Gaiellaceae bacterium]